jgi:hypothetical protein
MLMNLQYIIVVVLYLILSIDAINCKGCVPLDTFTFDKVGFCPAYQYLDVCLLTYSNRWWWYYWIKKYTSDDFINIGFWFM